jgi:hypothetical protein
MVGCSIYVPKEVTELRNALSALRFPSLTHQHAANKAYCFSSVKVDWPAVH